ncbi:hypothetical protein RvY_19134 [Ramazzottius varieornatus]|uniref:Uncharacterized protein n=1 Tax=Ramazzottius varieornatus TaxID=947166 RepID=A0A1D1W8D9_RAMVA|nr:hypothetical protein RvY_19134 [Ramazzottius varieornatus]
MAAVNLFTLEESEPAMAADSNLFSVPASLTDRYRVEEERIAPTAVIPEHLPAFGEMTFYIPPYTDASLALPELAFELELSIQKRKVNTNLLEALSEDDKVAPVNLIAHSLFRSVQISLCNRLVSDCAQHYLYRAMIEALTTYSEGALRTALTSAGFYYDTPGAMDAAAENKEEVARQKLFTAHKWVQLSGKVYSDVTSQEKNLVTGVPVHIRFQLNSPAFYLRSWGDNDLLAPGKEYRGFIQNPRLLIKRYVGAPDFMNSLAKNLVTTTAKYHLEKQLLRVIDIPIGTTGTQLPNIHMGQEMKQSTALQIEGD